nr:uncharacterized protein LOC107421129 isoform X1 [Ziziphus jujuba var. spinosa]XP_048331782.1 uncharacterized protein LOC107421129 isoform X1 [Ziziphus jujuba var. spinosa]XP_048331783.1 uncharacterized protein LOC107421129 isoform X1 [Ziziphus jujuba var. spinosa]
MKLVLKMWMLNHSMMQIYLTACFAEVNIDIVRLIHAFLWVTIWNSYYIDGDILRIAVLLLVQPSKMTHYITLLMSTILMWSLQSFNRVKAVHSLHVSFAGNVNGVEDKYFKGDDKDGKEQ